MLGGMPLLFARLERTENHIAKPFGVGERLQTRCVASKLVVPEVAWLHSGSEAATAGITYAYR